MKKLHIAIIGFIVLTILYVIWETKLDDDNLKVWDAVFDALYYSIAIPIAFQVVSAFKQFLDYHKLIGHWDEFITEQDNGRKIAFNTSTGNVVVKYIDGNILKVVKKKVVKKRNSIDRKWKGVLVMGEDNPKEGKLNYYYPDTKNDEHEFGSKQVIFTKDKRYDYLYLIDLNLGGNVNMKTGTPDYGKSVLRRCRKSCLHGWSWLYEL